jgi:hypothetical protein
MRRNVDCDPEYVRDRIEETNNLGRKYLVSIGLCAILIATIEGGLRGSDLSAVPSSVLRLEVSQMSFERPTHELCAIQYPIMNQTKHRPHRHEIDA